MVVSKRWFDLAINDFRPLPGCPTKAHVAADFEDHGVRHGYGYGDEEGHCGRFHLRQVR
jgi:hypothetical protein